MSKRKIFFSAVLISILGVLIIVNTISKITSSFGYLITFSVGMGLFVGPIIGVVLSVFYERKNK